MLIAIGGMIGVGKTLAANLIADHLDAPLHLESVEGNVILEKFYTATPEEEQAKRYPFLLQLAFLNSRFSDIKRALESRHAVLDRSIYEDWYFARINTDLGRISELEFSLYENLLANMMEELEFFPKKAPDLFVFLHADFDTIINRISRRGRDFEQDASQLAYFRRLWEGYRDWVENRYHESPVLVFDTDRYDLSDPESQRLLLELVDQKLAESALADAECPVPTVAAVR
ncbi:deoxynucleoside kinase [Trueperella pyogenes]|uniref:deoxynucleoside kinase n=1 Tax=Trueperella pyogenes TaxID=1661 RepID=UPI000581FEC4|nr:deoxynucleoside kinase [Trueperella pyogenes]AJC68786.1 deoxyadenosine kinase [Trueperella pyogenes TP8]WHU57709.1 deoxynucleoside kinase [Trueperella pyogenes]